MKYIKGKQTFKLDQKDCSYVKVSMDAGEGTERPWAFKSNETGELFLANHAVHLYPFESWGMNISSTKLNKEDIDGLLVGPRHLHPDAWDAYIKNGVIDEEGNPIIKKGADG